MNRVPTLGLWAVLSSSLLVGCYQTADELDLYTFSEEYAQEYCRRVMECCDAEEIAAFPLHHPGGSRRDCVLRMRSRLTNEIEEQMWRGVAGSELDPAAARECLAAMRHGVCGDRTESSEVCIAVLRPRVGLGERCDSARDCTTLACAGVEGVCVEPRREGESCEFPPDLGFCELPLRCDGEPPVCVEYLPACDGL